MNSTVASPDPAASTARAKKIGWWLLGTAGMVYTMVVVGGWTRITKSGLSMISWHPVWQKYDPEAEFELYKSTPEFQRVNKHMSAEEFEQIYFWEWFHRMWGRAIGGAFIAPLVYFSATSGGIPSRYMGIPIRGKILGLLALGGAQGGIGWWMVKSGLEHERFDEYSIPRVSPYRLATHLGIAFSIYSLLVWTGLDLMRGGLAKATRGEILAARKMFGPSVLASSIVALTVASGAFVAGNDAGHAYNDWPLMAGKFIPEEFWNDKLGLRNIFENTATVQFDHRMLAYSSIAAIGFMKMKKAQAKRLYPGSVMSCTNMGMNVMGGLVLAQATLGIATLMMYVPPSLAAAHQAGALALLTAGIFVSHSLNRIRKLPLAETAAAAVPEIPKAAKGAAVASVAFLMAHFDAERRRESQRE